MYTFTVCSRGSAQCGAVVGFALGAREGVSVVGEGTAEVERCLYGLSNSLSWSGSSGSDCKDFDTVLEGRVPFSRLCRVVNTGNGGVQVYSSPSGSCTYVVEGTRCAATGSF